MPKRLTPSGMVYTHRNILTNAECEGSRKPVKSIEAQLAEAREEVMEAVKAVQEADEPTRRKTGYTDEQLEDMLRDLTPKRRRFRDWLSHQFHRRRGCCDE
jgi:hypothetical protein